MKRIADSAVIIVAGGSGRRMEQVSSSGSLPKQFMELAGLPLFVHCLRAFAAVPEVRRTVVVSKAEYLELTRQILIRYGFTESLVVSGGETRQQSVARGLEALADLPERPELVAVHDGVRPLVSPELIRRCLAAATEHGAAIAAVMVRDTLKRQVTPPDTASPNPSLPSLPPLIETTVQRDGLWQAQTPQVFRFSLLQTALAAATNAGYLGTDEAALVERIGHPVALVAGSLANLKLTLPDDFSLAAALLQFPATATVGAGSGSSAGIRIGQGYDVHQLTAGRELILGGVKIEHSLGLLGHSDADVLTHALCDAILGALGAGDLGRHFPDNDPQYRGISSLKLLLKVMEQARVGGYRLVNADLTIIAQRPRLAPYHQAMQANLAAACGVVPELINIKATTTEGLGFAGREEGIAACAVVLLTN